MQSNSFAAMSPALIDAIAKVKAMTHLSKGERHKIGERVMALIEAQERIAARTNKELSKWNTIQRSLIHSRISVVPTWKPSRPTSCIIIPI